MTIVTNEFHIGRCVLCKENRHVRRHGLQSQQEGSRVLMGQLVTVQAGTRCRHLEEGHSRQREQQDRAPKVGAALS